MSCIVTIVGLIVHGLIWARVGERKNRVVNGGTE